MGRKKKRNKAIIFCFYCDRLFESEKVLIQHQRAKHFKCPQCHKRMSSAHGMMVHVFQVHKETIEKVPSAKSGRDSFDVEIFGMAGVPQDLIEQRRAKIYGEPVNKKPRVDGQRTITIPTGILIPGTPSTQVTQRTITIPGQHHMGGQRMPGMPMGAPMMMPMGQPLMMMPPPGGYMAPPPMPPPSGPPPSMGAPPTMGAPPPGPPPTGQPFGAMAPPPSGPKSTGGPPAGPKSTGGRPVAPPAGQPPRGPFGQPPRGAFGQPPFGNAPQMGMPPQPGRPMGMPPQAFGGPAPPMSAPSPLGAQAPKKKNAIRVYEDEKLSMEEKRAMHPKYSAHLNKRISSLQDSIEERLKTLAGNVGQ